MSASASSDKVMTDIAGNDAMRIQQAEDLECARALHAELNPGRTRFVRLVPAEIGLRPFGAADIKLPRGIILVGCGRLSFWCLFSGLQLLHFGLQSGTVA